MFLVRILALWFACNWAWSIPPAIDGTVIVNNVFDDQQAPVQLLNLQGNWRFFPGDWVNPGQLPSMTAKAQSIAVPGSWQTGDGWGLANGIGTYWLQLSVHKAISEPMALRFRRLCGASTFYFFPDGNPAQTPLFTRGTASRNAAGEVASGSDTLIPLPTLQPGLYHLLIQQSNHHYYAGGICGPVTLGPATEQSHAQTVQLTKHIVVVALLMFLALGALVLGSQNGDKATPWLALVCAAIGLLIASSSGIIEALVPPGSRWPQRWQYTLAYCAVVWLPTALIMLHWRTFAMALPRWVIALNLIVASALSLAFLALPTADFIPFTSTIAVICCIQLATSLALVIAAVRLRRRYALLALMATLPVLLCTPFDFYRYYYGGITELASPYAMAFLIAVHGWIYTVKFGGAYQLAARLSTHLQEEVERRTSELRDKNNKLEVAQAALQRANEALKELSITDGLTQVYNRMHFEQQFDKEWRRCARQGLPLSVLMIDADHFKQLNDSAGHLAGDQCLQALAAVLQQHFKRSGELVARYGGEEFIVLLPDTNQSKALAVAEGLRAAVERLTVEHEGRQYRVTISIGVSTTVPAVEQPPAQLLATADAALYEAKDAGRNRVHSIPLLGQRRVMAQQQLRL